jgi:hypothetical protein
VLDWGKRDPAWLGYYKELLALRARAIAPRRFGPGKYRMLGERAFEVKWDGLALVANCSDAAIAVEAMPSGDVLWSNGKAGAPWSVEWRLAA